MGPIWLGLAVVLSTSLSFGREVLFRRSVPFDQAICNFGGHKVGLFLRHDQPKEPATKETRGAPLVYLGSSQVHLIQMLGEPNPSDYFFLKPNEKSLCDKTQGFDMGQGRTAIFYLEDNRPFQDVYHVIIYNYKTDRVLENKKLGTVSNLISMKDQFAYSLLTARSDAQSVQMTSPSGQKLTATDEDLNAFRVVKVENEKVKDEFDPNLSYEKNKWKKYFKSKAEFLKAAGWDKANKKFKNEVVYEATQAADPGITLRETCVVFLEKRDSPIAPKDWRCRKEKI